MNNHAVAVKALIVEDNKLLMLKNSLNDPHRPGATDFPGGRLEPGEDPYKGLKREIKEELGEEAAEALHIGEPLDVCGWQRPDGQTITGIFFYCNLYTRPLDAKTPEVKLSDEHSSYEWIDLDLVALDDKYKLGDNMKRPVERLFSFLYR